MLDNKDKEKALIEIIKKYNADSKNIISILHESQDLYGYIPAKVQKIIAAKLWIEMQDVYNEIINDSYLTLKPLASNITVCCGNSCVKNGSYKIYNLIEKELEVKDGLSSDKKFFLSMKRCFGMCGKPPVITVDNDMYKNVKEDEVINIIKKHKIDIDK